MKIYVNGSDLELREGATIEQVLTHFEVQQKSGIAVALNDKVVRKSDFEKLKVNSGDRVEIIRATQGG
ncbi:MAG: sulfur carrier protein ThiS [Bacteroidetes bacterium]|nr:sulfur carrier protein ThiS [Bacteroidota bacterium]